MTFGKIRKHLLIAVVSLPMGFVAGFIAAFVTWPFWGWFENASGIESLGHSGPADWVLEFLFVLCSAAVFGILEWVSRSKDAPEGEPQA
jgi:hypothetical protein